MTETVVIKVGSSSLIKEAKQKDGSIKTSINLRQLSSIVEVCVELKEKGFNVVLVSSGAVGSGRHQLNIANPPATLAARQALAAIGQVHLMSKYETFFSSLKAICAQILITYDTFRIREHYTNAENTFKALFKMGAIPIVNENDTVATQEIRSENDTMAAMVASLVGAKYLFLLTDVNGLFTANPKTDPSAKRIEFVDDFRDIEALIGSLELAAGSTWGSGGMAVKINASNLAASLGIQTTILSAVEVDETINICLAKGVREMIRIGTTFFPVRNPPGKKKRWIRGLRCMGSITVDDGAAEAVLKRQNIYAVGVKKVEGNFPYMAAIKILDMNGTFLGIGLSNMSSEYLIQAKGMKTEEMQANFGWSGCLIFRKNLAVNFSRNTSLKNLNRLSEKSDEEIEDEINTEVRTHSLIAHFED